MVGAKNIEIKTAIFTIERCIFYYRGTNLENKSIKHKDITLKACAKFNDNMEEGGVNSIR